jgi:hypothetical protein
MAQSPALTSLENTAEKIRAAGARPPSPKKNKMTPLPAVFTASPCRKLAVFLRFAQCCVLLRLCGIRQWVFVL